MTMVFTRMTAIARLSRRMLVPFAQRMNVNYRSMSCLARRTPSVFESSNRINWTQRAFMKEYATPGAPLSLEQVQRRVMDVFRAFDKTNKENLALGSSFTSDLGLDSLDMVEVVIAVEEDFNLEIPDRAADEFKCPNDIVRYMYEQCGDYDVPEAEKQKMFKEH